MVFMLIDLQQSEELVPHELARKHDASLQRVCTVTDSLVSRHQIFRARHAALSKNRVWTPSLVKLGRNYTSVVSCCRTNQIAQVK